jgi:hypothetical protein
MQNNNLIVEIYLKVFDDFISGNYFWVMNLGRYEIEYSDSFYEFEFVSRGKKGEITKVVQYQPTAIPFVYNLGFGDNELSAGKLSDSIVSDHGDGRKVLITVADTVLQFTKRHPFCAVFAMGSSKSSTRLYQIGISNNLAEVTKFLDVYGQVKGQWEVFEKGKNYDAFLVIKKN